MHERHEADDKPGDAAPDGRDETPTARLPQLRMLALCPALFIQAFMTSAGVR
jgi:hypothetical protein